MNDRFLAYKRISTQTKKMQFITSTQTRGATFYCGARGGDRYLRIYDKNYESNGEIDSVRYEMQLRGERANAIFDHVASGKGFSFAESGIMIPPSVFSSAAAGLISTLSANGLMFIVFIDLYS